MSAPCCARWRSLGPKGRSSAVASESRRGGSRSFEGRQIENREKVSNGG